MVIWCAHATCSMVISAHFRPHRHPPSRDTCYLFSHLGPHDASFFFSSSLLFLLSSNARLVEICRKIADPSVYFHRFVSSIVCHVQKVSTVFVLLRLLRRYISRATVNWKLSCTLFYIYLYIVILHIFCA